MLNLRDFGSALRAERTRIGNSVAKFAKETAGISKADVHDFEEGKRAPDKLTLKKIVHCFPILMQFEGDLRAGNYQAPEKESTVKHSKPKPPPREPTRLQPQARCKGTERRQPRLEIVRQNVQAPALLTAPLAVPLVRALRKTRVEVLTELQRVAVKRLGAAESEEYDFTIKRDEQTLVVKLRVAEGEEMVESGSYVTVAGRGDGLVVFVRGMTSGNYGDVVARAQGVVALLGVAAEMHVAVKDRKFE